MADRPTTDDRVAHIRRRNGWFGGALTLAVAWLVLWLFARDVAWLIPPGLVTWCGLMWAFHLGWLDRDDDPCDCPDHTFDHVTGINEEVR